MSMAFEDNVIIDSAFGSPTCVWNGGRTLTNIYYDKQQLKNIRDTYLNLGIKIRFIFTNSLLNEYDLMIDIAIYLWISLRIFLLK